VLDGITWTNLAISSAYFAAMVAAPVAALLGLLPRSKMRSWSIWLWASLPISIGLVVVMSQPIGLAPLWGVLVSAVLPSWVAFSLLSYILIAGFRQFLAARKAGIASRETK
jgi:hypothetical protein